MHAAQLLPRRGRDRVTHPAMRGIRPDPFIVGRVRLWQMDRHPSRSRSPVKMLRPFLVLAAVAALPAVVAPALAAGRQIDGRWAGGPATCSTPFVIRGGSYAAPGTKPFRIRKVERSGGWWRVELVDRYAFVLRDVKPKSMTWHSPASGDTFELRRCA